jgi:hypothetical protein
MVLASRPPSPAIRPAAFGARRRNRLARHALGDGHGGDFEHDRGGPIAQTLSADGKPTGEAGKALGRRFRASRMISLVDRGGKAQRARKKPPY